MNKTIGKRLKNERLKVCLTIQQVCHELFLRYEYRLSVGKLNEMERGKNKDYGYMAFVYLSMLYGVSADYLLGLTDVKSTNLKIQEISKLTGLSEAAIVKLSLLEKFSQEDNNDQLFLDIINRFIENI